LGLFDLVAALQLWFPNTQEVDTQFKLICVSRSHGYAEKVFFIDGRCAFFYRFTWASW
jgi:hypothetical protein